MDWRCSRALEVSLPMPESNGAQIGPRVRGQCVPSSVSPVCTFSFKPRRFTGGGAVVVTHFSAGQPTLTCFKLA